MSALFTFSGSFRPPAKGVSAALFSSEIADAIPSSNIAASTPSRLAEILPAKANKARVRVWILGAGGLLGSAVHSMCNKSNIFSLAMKRDEADITHMASLRKMAEKIRPTHIVNCAAYTDVDGAEKEPELAFRVNADGPYNVGVVAREFDARVVHISTDYVFDGIGKRPYIETDPCQPLGAYAQSKWEGENNLLTAFPLACIIRTSWLFGVRGKNFISSILNLMHSKMELKVVADQLGRPTFCEDLAQAIVALLGHTGIFHFANSGEVSRYNMAVEIFEEVKRRGVRLACEKIIPVNSGEFPTLAKRPLYSVLDTAKISAILGDKPRDWKEALKEYLNHVT